jgi:hypothetical protein
MKPKAAMQLHYRSDDWCHFCGERKAPTVDIWYPDNAEHDSAVEPGPLHSGRHYIRICSTCARRIQDVADKKDVSGT